MSYMEMVVKTHPHLAKMYVVGKTYEERNLSVIVLRTSTSKKRIWIDCGFHAVITLCQIHISKL